MPTITPFLWFDDRLEEAVEFYRSVFKDATVISTQRIGDGPGEPGKVMSMTFALHGQRFMDLNGSPQVTLNEAFSLFVSCADQAEVDYFWSRLLEGGGRPSQCGWLKDRFGLSRQKGQRVLQAMLTMTKIDIAALQQAHGGHQ